MTPIDMSKYPPDWSEIARRVKESAGWKCDNCGHKNDYAAGRVLTVHHIDFDPKNNEPHNLIALCQACHLRRHVRPSDYNPDQLDLFGSLEEEIYRLLESSIPDWSKPAPGVNPFYGDGTDQILREKKLRRVAHRIRILAGRDQGELQERNCIRIILSRTARTLRGAKSALNMVVEDVLEGEEMRSQFKQIIREIDSHLAESTRDFDAEAKRLEEIQRHPEIGREEVKNGADYV